MAVVAPCLGCDVRMNLAGMNLASSSSSSNNDVDGNAVRREGAGCDVRMKLAKWRKEVDEEVDEEDEVE